MSDGMVRKWVRMFNEGRENVHDEARSGRPSLVNDDLVRKVNERVRDDRRFTISDLSLHFPQISMTLLYDIVSSHLGYRKQRGAQKTACCMWFDISDALSQGRRRHVEPYCDRRRDMGVAYHTWIKTAVLALEANWLAEKENVQAGFNKEDHVHRILGQTRCSLGRIFAPGHNNKLCCLLWNAEETEACNSKQKAQNADCHHSFASR